MNKISLDITPKDGYTIPNLKNFWNTLGEGGEDEFLEIIEDDETREYFKEAVKNLRWLKNGLSILER